MRNVGKLTIWKTQLPDVKLGLLPSSVPRPNPLVAGSRVFVSIFSPGAVVCLDRGTGEIEWRRELPKFAADCVYLAGGTLFARSAHTLVALTQQSGRELWRFCPYGTDGEWLYSHPTVSRQRLFIGDRRGYLHCLDARTGATVWKAKTNQKNANVNATPVVSEDIVIVSTNAKSALAFDVVSGSRVWKRALDGPASYGLVKLGRNVIANGSSIFLLESRTGEVRARFRWKDRSVVGIDRSGRNLVAVLGDPKGIRECALAVCDPRGEQISEVRHDVWCPALRYTNETGFGYLSHLKGIRVLDRNANKITDITLPGYGVGLVDVSDGVIYLTTGQGRVMALKHPTV